MPPSPSRSSKKICIMNRVDNKFNFSKGIGPENMPLLSRELDTQTDLGDTEPDLAKEKDCDFSPDQVY